MGGFRASERVFAVALRRMMPVAGSTSYSSLAVGEKTSACMPAGSDTPTGDCTPNSCVLACHSLQKGNTYAISWSCHRPRDKEVQGCIHHTRYRSRSRKQSIGARSKRGKNLVPIARQALVTIMHAAMLG